MSADVVIDEVDKEVPVKLKEKKFSWENLVRFDSFYVQSAIVSGLHGHGTMNLGWDETFKLAFQSLGVVYGDLGTSPLYVFASTFSNGVNHNDDILGVLSLMFYTLTIITLIKYVFIVLWANDNGDGGTFALYSLLCRYAKVGLIPSQQAEDRDVSNFRLESPSDNRDRRASKLKSMLENSYVSKYILLLMTMLGTSMVVGDGVLTPCISVLSAVEGIKEAASSLTEEKIVWISVAILICLFMVQRFGTDKVGYCFAPIIILWFLFIASIGAYNFAKHDPSVIKALNPKYIIDYFRRNKKDAWISLGGAVLCITGSEAMFADLGQFSVRAIQISMSFVVYPSIILAYAGQASWLRKHNSEVADIFYKSIPGPLYWPVFVVAVAAAVIASQAMISGSFSIIQQSLSLGCFPRVKIVHTSAKYKGQVYIPEVNYLLMLACVFITIGFKTTVKIGNAYGIAVVFVTTLTSAFLVLIMIMIWKTNILLVISYVVIIMSIELFYLSSVLYKFDQGGYLPLAFAALLVLIMFVWNYVHRLKYMYELENKVPPERLREVAANPSIRRIAGFGLFYSELVQGIPPIFKHYVDNIPALHSVLVFVSIKSLPLGKVSADERFLFRRVGPRELAVFRCVVRYGYVDKRIEKEYFEKNLVERLKEFIREESFMSRVQEAVSGRELQENGDHSSVSVSVDGGDFQENGGVSPILAVAEEVEESEVQFLEEARRDGVVYLLGESEVVAGEGSSLTKRVLINFLYNVLKRNVRQGIEMLDIPRKSMLKVGMTCEL